MSGKLTIGNPGAAAKLAALRARAAKPEDGALVKQQQIQVAPEEAKDRLRFLADDSGSMQRYIEDVKDGVIESLRNCVPGQTSAAIHFLCSPNEKLAVLNSNLVELASLMKAARFGMGGTPLFSSLKRTIETDPVATRVIAFTDGSPTDAMYSWRNPAPPELSSALAFPTQKDAEEVVQKALERKIPLDTIFFGSGESTRYTEGGAWEKCESDEVKLMKYLAERTGGYFLLAKDKQVLKTALKYLAPVNRLLLASESVRKEIESGTRS